MATIIFRTGPTVEARSGGKITRGRRIAAAKTPYDRPHPAAPPSPPPPQNPNPNWLTAATRIIASGAGTLISSVFGPHSSDTDSSSDSSSSASENDFDDENDEYDITRGRIDGLNKNTGMSSETINCLKEPQPTVWMSETKCGIEKLLLQETFSREECDRLINIISSRVADCSTIKEGDDGKLSEIPNRTLGDDVPDLYSKAVLEAKRWLEGKKVGSTSKSKTDLDHGTCTFNSAELLHVTEGEVGSPVDIARSYMRDPWASPSISPIELRTPSSVGIKLYKEETPYSAGVNSLSSSKQQKRDSLATGSWNIMEELRRVRSKATEDMLRTLPSAEINMSSFAEPKYTLNSSVSLARGVLEMTNDGSFNRALSSNPAICVSEQNQIMEDEGGAASKPHLSTVVDFPPKQHTDSRSSERNCSAVEVRTESRDTPTANGFLSSASSLAAGLEKLRNQPRSSEDENPNSVNSSHGKLTNSIPPVEETCELLSEASVEVPVVNETNSVGSGSQNSSSMHDKELLQLTSKRTLAGKTGKQQGRKLRKYNKRGKGRGK